MKYHGIILGGNLSLIGGRNIASFRLRTEAKKHGYTILALDSSVALRQHELEDLLKNTVTDETVMIGISTVWLNGYNDPKSIEWLNDSFFLFIKTNFPHVKIVAGGPEGNWVVGARVINRNSDWAMTGFSDVSFTKLLDLLHGKKDHGLIYSESAGKNIVSSNSAHIIINPDDIETEFEEADGFLAHQPLPLEVSRGCIFRCSFCNHPFQGAKDYDSYIRTVDSLARELRRNYELFGTTRYSIMDDTFNDSIEKLDRLLRAIEKSKIPSFQFMSYIKPELLVTKPEMIPMLKDLGMASGFVGIESMQPAARKAVKKGMDANRILDAIAELNMQAGSSMHASFIVGLPGDTKDDIFRTNEFLTGQKNQYFKSWVFHNMGLYYDRNLQGFSEIDKNPEKFGDKVIEKKPEAFAYWETDHMNRTEAKNIVEQLNQDGMKYMGIAGWTLPLAWHVGMSDNDINTITLAEFEPYRTGLKASRQQALDTLQRLNGV